MESIKQIGKERAVLILYKILNMCLSNQQERARRNILKSQFKSARDTEAQLRFRQTVLKRRRRIQQLQAAAVPNLIYIFPRSTLPDSSSGSDEDWQNQKDEWVYYDLKSQNKKDKNYQTQTSSLIHARCASTGEAISFRTDSAPKGLIRSQRKGHQDIEAHYCSKKAKQDKSSGKKAKIEDVNLSNYNSRKADKTALNSSKKLLMAQQYSLASQQSRTKKVSQVMTLTCRRKQPPRSRLATEHN